VENRIGIYIGTGIHIIFMLGPVNDDEQIRSIKYRMIGGIFGRNLMILAKLLLIFTKACSRLEGSQEWTKACRNWNRE
jgi:hypothetical protein